MRSSSLIREGQLGSEGQKATYLGVLVDDLKVDDAVLVGEVVKNELELQRFISNFQEPWLQSAKGSGDNIPRQPRRSCRGCRAVSMNIRPQLPAGKGMPECAMALPPCWAKATSLISYSQARALCQPNSKATYDADERLNI